MDDFAINQDNEPTVAREVFFKVNKTSSVYGVAHLLGQIREWEAAYTILVDLPLSTNESITRVYAALFRDFAQEAEWTNLKLQVIACTLIKHCGKSMIQAPNIFPQRYPQSVLDALLKQCHALDFNPLFSYAYQHNDLVLMHHIVDKINQSGFALGACVKWPNCKTASSYQTIEWMVLQGIWQDLHRFFDINIEIPLQNTMLRPIVDNMNHLKESLLRSIKYAHVREQKLCEDEIKNKWAVAMDQPSAMQYTMYNWQELCILAVKLNSKSCVDSILEKGHWKHAPCFFNAILAHAIKNYNEKMCCDLMSMMCAYTTSAPSSFIYIYGQDVDLIWHHKVIKRNKIPFPFDNKTIPIVWYKNARNMRYAISQQFEHIPETTRSLYEESMKILTKTLDMLPIELIDILMDYCFPL